VIEAVLDCACRRDNNGREKFLRKAMEFALTVLSSGLITPVARVVCAGVFHLSGKRFREGTPWLKFGCWRLSGLGWRSLLC